MNPLISVIVPVYKVEPFLPRCLDSIVNQTYRNLEIILVDDGSPDNCGAICDDYAGKDPRIRVIHQENRGLSAARNRGLDIMQGRYLMFADSDDWMPPEAVQVLYDRLIRDGSDMAIGKHVEIYTDGREDDAFCRWMRDCVVTPQEVFASLGNRERFSMVAWGKLYRRELFSDLRYPPIFGGEDNWVFPYLVERCGKISSVNHVVYFYFQFEKSIMHVYNHGAQTGNLEACLHMTAYLLEHNFTGAARQWFGNSIASACRVKLRTAAVEQMDRYFSGTEQRELLKHQTLKRKLMWAALRSPLLSALLRKIRTLRDR